MNLATNQPGSGGTCMRLRLRQVTHELHRSVEHHVMEGSTRRGQIILRTLQALLDISHVAGGRFFAGHGKAIGAMWRGYLAALELAGAATASAWAIEDATLDTFGTFDRWFGQEARP